MNKQMYVGPDVDLCTFFHSTDDEANSTASQCYLIVTVIVCHYSLGGKGSLERFHVSIQDGTLALGMSHTCSALSLSITPRAAFRNVPMLG